MIELPPPSVSEVHECHQDLFNIPDEENKSRGILESSLSSHQESQGLSLFFISVDIPKNIQDIGASLGSDFWRW